MVQPGRLGMECLWTWKGCGTWISIRKMELPEGIVWGGKDQASPTGLWVVPPLALVGLGLHAKVGQIACAPEPHGSYSGLMVPWQNTVWVLVELSHFPWGCLKAQGSLDGTADYLHPWHRQIKPWCLCSGLHTQAVIPCKFLCKLWAKGQVPASKPDHNLETVQLVVSSHRGPLG